MRSGPGVMGSGYGRHSAAQHVGIGTALGMLDRAVAALPLPDDGRALRVADLGCASGGNALEPMARVVAGARGRAPGIAVAVTHTDIRGNDFNALVETLAAPDAYPAAPGVFAYAEARSFFSPLFPPGELHLAWSSIAVHWLSHVPQPIPDHVYCSGATGAVREALRERSAADWRDFLRHRAVELAPGGRLVVVGGAATDEGASGAEGLFGMVVEELRARIEDGQLSSDRFAAMTVPTWNRTSAEFLDPLRRGPASDWYRLEEEAFAVLPDPLHDRYGRDGDLDAYAREVTASFMAAFGPSLFPTTEAPGGADGPSGAADELVRDFRSGLTARIRAHPADARTNWRVQLLRAARTDTPSRR
ncbi:hypothetical protein [Streptomyces sp. NPDC001568]|uniref:hypothetical protein n=1 Tax=Streptomyces sp. NPDC001568 TaxID=3364588 RepID=UPI0036CA9475